ncbi:MAG TPA: phosphatase PAP2 family protein [Ktedonobacteraceae bacterium]|nr:phosphatase PAP2 family protein [Ktedonobacteraceae bacterium]
MGINYALFQDLNSHAGIHPWLDIFMIFCAQFLIFLWPLIMIAFWGRPLRWWKRSALPEEVALKQEQRASVLWTAFACLLAYGINLTIEQFIFEPRPFITHHVHVLVSHVADASFPSDHTAWSFAVIGMFFFSLLPTLKMKWRQQIKAEETSPATVLRTPWLLMLIALIMGCLVGIGRVFVGVHYPGDVIGGAIDGLIAACIITMLRHLLQRPTTAVLQFASRIQLT